MRSKEEMIRNYIHAYNRYDIDGMLTDLDENIKFVNISNGEINMTLTGRDAFRKQAQAAKEFFLKRSQEITAMVHKDEETEIAISYYGVVAADLPNGLKKGDELNLRGRSVFKFSGAKIIGLTDIS